MKPTLKLYLKPKVKIGRLAWSLKHGVCRADYFQNPSDDLLMSRKVISYSINYKNGVAKIVTYNYDNGSDTLEHGWAFPTKKELKAFLRAEMIKKYRTTSKSDHFRPRIDKFVLTQHEKDYLEFKRIHW